MNLAYNTDKRRYIRYELLDFAVMYVDGDTTPLNVVITDIGLGGVQVRTKEALTGGVKCVLQVNHTDGNTTDLRCEVRHASAIANSDLVQAGIRFVPESHQERMRVAEFVHQIFRRQADELGA